MAIKICIVSGKGGVGKSTITANMGYALAKKGKRVLLVDLDFGLNSLDLLLSCKENIVFDINDVLAKKCRFKQALITDENMPNLYCLLSGQFMPTKSNVYSFCSMITKEQNAFDYLLFDCGAGIGDTLDYALKLSDEVIVVATPHLISVKDAQNVIEYCKNFSPTKIYAVLNRVRGDLVKSGSQMDSKAIFSYMGVLPLGIIPEADKLNGFCRQDSPYFDLVADNLLNGKQILYDYLKAYEGVFGNLRLKIKNQL